jgi:hypothetical protein
VFVYSGRGNRLIRGLGLALKRLQAVSGKVVTSGMGGVEFGNGPNKCLEEGDDKGDFFFKVGRNPLQREEDRLRERRFWRTGNAFFPLRMALAEMATV